MMAAPLGSQYRTTMYGGTDLTTSLTRDYQFQFGNNVAGSAFLFGAGTSYLVTQVTGLVGRQVRATETPRPNATGAFTNIDYVGARTVTFSMIVQGSQGTLQSKVDDFYSAWTSPDNGDRPMLFRLPTGQAYRVFGRPRRSEMDIKMWRQGVVGLVAEVYCADPRMYAETKTVPATVASPTSLSAPVGIGFGTLASPARTFPFTFGIGTTSASVTATTTGTTAAPWHARITGPISNPRLSNGTLALQFNGTLGSGEYIVIDSLNRNVWFNGTEDASWYGYLTGASSWWDLAPNTSTTVTLSDDGTRTGSAGSLAFDFRSARL